MVRLSDAPGITLWSLREGGAFEMHTHGHDEDDLAAAGSITVNPERAPGVQRVTEIRDRVRELQGACVFAEPQFDRRIVDVVVEGTQARAGTIDPLGADIEDGPELYFELMRTLTASFKECLTPAS